VDAEKIDAIQEAYTENRVTEWERDFLHDILRKESQGTFLLERLNKKLRS
jgi:hypothetical protein